MKFSEESAAESVATDCGRAENDLRSIFRRDLQHAKHSGERSPISSSKVPWVRDLDVMAYTLATTISQEPVRDLDVATCTIATTTSQEPVSDLGVMACTIAVTTSQEPVKNLDVSACNIATTTSQESMINSPGSELNLTDLPDLEEIPEPRTTQSRTVKVTNEPLPSPMKPESCKVILETNGALEELRTQLDRAALRLDKQQTTSTLRVNGRHVPPGCDEHQLNPLACRSRDFVAASSRKSIEKSTPEPKAKLTARRRRGGLF